ncbi:hypothetical protein GCM10009617_38060 [Leifsonia poae]|uniref:DUF559 domain-containing protein n=1 Tax=Leifsonia poae TaxID=110933 RepID=A0A9W6M0A3_9MICO|nr:hypothetical protein GCM10017584_22840 [Leifsonia poae]
MRTRLVRAGVSGMIANPTITTATGRVYRGDLTFPEQRVILEYQGDVHRPVHRFRADMTRQLDLQADGWTVVYLGPGDLDDHQLVRRVRAILALHTAPPPSPPS